MSSGPRAALPTVAEHGIAPRGVVSGDDTSQSAGFTRCGHRQPGSVSIATAIRFSAMSSS
jgi:hypothetical protein